MSRIELLLVQMDEAYQQLSRRLDGLTDEEYLWQQVAGWLVDPPRRRWPVGRSAQCATLGGITVLGEDICAGVEGLSCPA